MTTSIKNKGIFVIWLIIAGAILIAGSAYWYYVDDIKPYFDKKGKQEGKIDGVGTSCKVDTDCMLVDSSPADYSVCWKGACEAIDYSLDKYIAVNQNSFGEFIDKVQPSKEEMLKKCGPAPACPVTIVNDKFVARCIENVCRKVSKAQATSGDTSNWKTYRNEKYGFELRYPQKWNDIILFDGPKESSRGPFTEGVFSVSIGFKDESVFYFVLTLDEQKTIQDYIKADPESFVSYATNKESVADTVVGNTNAKQFIITSSESGRWQIVLWERNGVSYRLIYRLEDDSERALFEEILSTFKFIR